MEQAILAADQGIFVAEQGYLYSRAGNLENASGTGTATSALDRWSESIATLSCFAFKILGGAPLSAAAQHVRLGVDGRDGRSTIVDAIAVLRAEAGFGEHDTATIRVGILRPPSAAQVGLVEAVFDAPWADTVYWVPLRTATRFSGRIQGSAKQVDFDVIRLNRAKVDIHGTVTLADETTTLYAVEVSTAPEMTNPTKLDWRIIHAALKVIPGGEQCYRSLAEGASFAVPEVISNERVLDCDSLRWLKPPPPLKEIVAGVRRVDPELKVDEATDQKIADALRKFGLRVPKPRPQKKPRPRKRKTVKV